MESKRKTRRTYITAIMSLALTASFPTAIFAAETPQRDVLVTTDCGADMDDQWSIVHLALSPELKLIGVVTNFAPPPHGFDSTVTARCATDALSVGRVESVPVAPGSSAPIKDGATPNVNPGVKHLLRVSKAYSPSNRLAVIGKGPATDIASAWLIDHSIEDRIEVIALAFDSYDKGGDGWNVLNDPVAWKVVLQSKIPVVDVSGPVALRHLNLHRDRVAELFGSKGPAGEYFADLHGKWVEKMNQYFAKEVGDQMWPIWDDAMTAYLLGMTSSHNLPRPEVDLSDFDPSKPETLRLRRRTSASSARFTWVEEVDSDRLWKHLQRNIERVRKDLSPYSSDANSASYPWINE